MLDKNMSPQLSQAGPTQPSAFFLPVTSLSLNIHRPLPSLLQLQFILKVAEAPNQLSTTPDVAWLFPCPW